MSTLSVFIPGDPKGQPRPRAFARTLPDGRAIARVYDAGTAEGWKAQIALALRPLVVAPLDGPLAVHLAFQFSRPKSHYRTNGELTKGAPRYHTGKPDGDNLSKAVLDACTTLRLWLDDASVVSLGITKRWAGRSEPSGVHFMCQVLVAAPAEAAETPPLIGDLFAEAS